MAGGSKPSYPASLTDLQRLNHYEALGLTEASSSEHVADSLQKERWPWHLVEPEARQFATKRRLEAYAVLEDPHTRLAYDVELGFTRRHLSRVIGNDDSSWAKTWIVAFTVAGILLFLTGGAHVARTLGSTFAPDFEEVAVYHEPSNCVFAPCPGWYSREFRSSNDIAQWILDRQLVLAVAGPAALVVFAMVTRTAVARGSGYAVASVRYAGHRDTLVRFALFAPVLVAPLAVLLFVWFVPPEPIEIPSA
jgi:hypothetical protein